MSSSSFESPAKVLTIAGSDSGGAAGLQADLKTFTTLGVYGMSVITAVTAQNSLEVTALHSLPVEIVAAQLEAVLSDYGAMAVKTGFIGQVDLIEVIAAALRSFSPIPLVLDPVLVDYKGQAMFPPSVPQAYVDHLFPMTDLITPNREEAAIFTGWKINTLADMEKAALAIHSLGPKWVLVKGGLLGDDMVDLLYDGHDLHQFRTPRLDTQNTHGSGDTLSAAVATFLCQGYNMTVAVEKAHRFTAAAIRAGMNWQLGAGHGPVNHLS